MASTVGTADTWVREPQVKSLGGQCVSLTFQALTEKAEITDCAKGSGVFAGCGA